MEFILYIAKNKPETSDRYKDIDYPRVDLRYFDSRYSEYRSIMKFDFLTIQILKW
jgi:hypothetical protein